MQRLATSLGIMIALLAIAPAAEAGSYSFSIGGHRFRVEAPRNCRSASCVSVSSNRSIRPTEDAGVTSPPPAPAPAAPPANVVIPVRPATVVVPSPVPAAPVMAATTSQPVVLPPAPKPEASRPEAPSPHPPRVELPRIDPPKTVMLDPPRMEPPPVPSPEIKPTAAAAQRNDDEQAYTPLGEWESVGAKGTVRIERCGPALCGYALTEALSRGESVLVNMKPKSHDAWTGSIYSRSSGNTYYATMTLKSPGRLHVEACAFWRFWCSGNDWTRVEAPEEQLITTSRQWSARS
ncbi:DUF2147 domain-containing protein [Bradyrhizobium sp. CCBAU 53351]|uniref:DUF2147 domain-containing protein n=1 Tax=Bradyrhizobium sp. CCBAU 53351 TaxID=1325114 RepID=UPI0018898E5F|nr:DUF2147 domain-containing protein [Bradyrhizobium sp. CCBAU 53351]QOZ79034.1 DUF2147 domain-containing protein [Bradyrhizobium sp. CCBAU 53351]